MNRWTSIILGCGLLWYGILRGARGLVIGVKNYSFRSIDFATNTVALNLNILVKNPLLVGITIKGIQGDVYAQGVKVGTVNTTYDYYLSGSHTHVLPVVVNLNFGDVGNALLLNIQSGDIKNMTIAFDGKVYAGTGAIGIPVQFELDYNKLVA